MWASEINNRDVRRSTAATEAAYHPYRNRPDPGGPPSRGEQPPPNAKLGGGWW
jgi:hypothetical protein